MRHVHAAGGIDPVHGVDAHLGQAATTRPLAPHSAFARQHDVRYPIAQGPMTRVSDVAPFALAVAENGALPGGKVGGVGDVVRDLPLALERLGDSGADNQA